MSTNLEKLIENDWEGLKEIIQNKWSKLTSDDMDEAGGSYDALIDKIKKLYGNSRKEIEKELNKFFLSDEFEEIKDKFDKQKNELENGFFSLKNTVEKYVQNYLRCIKETSGVLEENVVSYAKENPFKILATATLICFAFNKIWNSKSK